MRQWCNLHAIPNDRPLVTDGLLSARYAVRHKTAYPGKHVCKLIKAAIVSPAKYVPRSFNVDYYFGSLTSTLMVVARAHHHGMLPWCDHDSNI